MSIIIDELKITVQCDICGETIPISLSEAKIKTILGFIPSGESVTDTINIQANIKNRIVGIKQVDGKILCDECKAIYCDELRAIESLYESQKKSLPARVKRIRDSMSDK